MNEVLDCLSELHDASLRRTACARRLRLSYDHAIAEGELTDDEAGEVRADWPP